ncbi:hypothetical protein N665_0518s0010 [Sinapis alba]|nr:hypothetical protein N665_0518s0010 [Sinapis alba]
MAKKWRQRTASSREKNSFQISYTSASSSVEKDCFVIYTADKARFAFLLSYLRNFVFQELLKISEEEFIRPPDRWTNHLATRFSFLGLSNQTGSTTNG